MTHETKFTKSYLSNDWEVSGNNEEEFFKLLLFVDEHTERIVPMNLKEYSLYSVKNNSEPLQAYVINPENILPNGELECRLTQELSEFEELSAETKKELRNDGLVIGKTTNPRNKYIVSKLAFPTLGQRIGFVASAMQRASLARDCHVAEYISDRSIVHSCQAVVKFDDEHRKKIFAFLSKSYSHMPLATLETIIDNLKSEGGFSDFEFVGYHASHRIVEARYAFPEYGEKLAEKYDLPEAMTPCIRIMSSDVGECSIRVLGYWETLRSEVIYSHNDFKRSHKGEFTMSDVTRGVRENVFDKYKEFPERLQQLTYVPVTPVSFKLETPEGQKKNGKFVCEVFILAIQELGIPKVIGSERMKELQQQLEFLVDMTQRYSAYAIAMDIMALPDELNCWMERSELGGAGYEMLLEKVSKAPYLDYEKIANKVLKKREAMFMTPGV